MGFYYWGFVYAFNEYVLRTYKRKNKQRGIKIQEKTDKQIEEKIEEMIKQIDEFKENETEENKPKLKNLYLNLMKYLDDNIQTSKEAKACVEIIFKYKYGEEEFERVKL